MRFFCVTPCLNAETYIEVTLRSVVEQTAFRTSNHDLIYVIQDGGSTDQTVVIARSIIAEYAAVESSCLNIQLNSASDTGMYDAIRRGFVAGPEADIYSYINAGDYYSSHAFDVVAEIFSAPFVHLLTGLEVAYNEAGHLIEAKLPQEYRRRLMLSGLYGSVLPFVQQESTFWDCCLHQQIDFARFGQQRFAGDFYLWRTFMETTPLYIVSAWLGGFRVHEGQLSDRFMAQYLQEVAALAQKPGLLDYGLAYWDRYAKYLPERIKRRFKRQTFEYDHRRKKYGLIGN